MKTQYMKHSPFTPAYLATLKDGDSFETEGIFQGVSKANTVWTLNLSDVGQYVFTVTYMGVFIAEYLADIKGENVVLEQIE